MQLLVKKIVWFHLPLKFIQEWNWQIAQKLQWCITKMASIFKQFLSIRLVAQVLKNVCHMVRQKIILFALFISSRALPSSSLPEVFSSFLLPNSSTFDQAALQNSAIEFEINHDWFLLLFVKHAKFFIATAFQMI